MKNATSSRGNGKSAGVKTSRSSCGATSGIKSKLVTDYGLAKLVLSGERLFHGDLADERCIINYFIRL